MCIYCDTFVECLGDVGSAGSACRVVGCIGHGTFERSQPKLK